MGAGCFTERTRQGHPQPGASVRNGPLGLGLSDWASRIGPLGLGLSVWASRFGPFGLGLSVWALVRRPPIAARAQSNICEIAPLLVFTQMYEIREPTEADRQAIALVAGLSFNSRATGQDVVLRRSLCAFDGERVIAVARAIPLGQWFGGARLACAGIAGVAVLPEYRGQGVARDLMRELLTRERAQGVLVSALYPTNVGLYRQVGYEYAGLRPQFRAAVAELPPAKGEVRELADDELDKVMNCFSRFASGHNGPVEVVEPDYWADLVLGQRGEGRHPRTVVVPGDGGFGGYASYYLDNRLGDDYRLACRHLVALNAEALRSLLGYFRRFQNAAKDLSWTGPPSTGVVGLSLQSNGFSIVPALTRWMMRILDVQQAVEARGYPQVEGEAVIAVDDPLFPANTGPWTLQAANGRVKVSPASGSQPKPVPIGLLSALFSGFATAGDLVLLGGLDEDDPALVLLSALFAGPVPWMPDAFLATAEGRLARSKSFSPS